MTDWGINYLTEEGNYANGKMHGKKTIYLQSKTGKRYVRSLENYNNGKRQNSKDYFVLESGKHYLLSENKYVNGKCQETIYYHSSGGIQRKDYCKDGKHSDTKCWYKSGKEIKEIKEGDAVTVFKSDEMCDMVDWMKTDWCKDKKTCTVMRFNK